MATDAAITRRSGRLFRFSHYLASRSIRVRRWSLLGYWVFIFGLTHWPGLDDLVPEAKFFRHSDKIAHFCVYAGWMVVWWWTLGLTGRKTPDRRIIAWLIAGGAAYAMLDEMSQAIVVRDPDLFDWLADLAGLLSATLLLRHWHRRRGMADGVKRPAANSRKSS